MGYIESVHRTWFVTALTRSEEDRIKDYQRSLVTENSLLGGHPRGFFHKGTEWTDLTTAARRAKGKKALHPSLRDKGNLLWHDHENFQRNKEIVEALLGILTPRCNSPQAIRDVFPDTYLFAWESPFPGIRQFTRIFEPGFCFNTPPLKTSYARGLDAMGYFMAAKALF